MQVALCQNNANKISVIARFAGMKFGLENLRVIIMFSQG